MQIASGEMAFFFGNSCAFRGCGMKFPTLADLIHHVEDTHIDNDPRLFEPHDGGKPFSLPLSCILRYSGDVERRDQYDMQKKQRPRAHSPAVSLPESTPTESEVEDESIKSDDDDSDDSWTTKEDFPTNVILNMMGGRERDTDGDRPYSCPIPGCNKKYKNVNGIKYHARHGHKNEVSKVKKSYRCMCGKSYRSASRLRNHTTMQHPSTEFSAPAPSPVTMSATVVSPPVNAHNVGASSSSSGSSSPAFVCAKDTTSLTDQLSLHTPSLPITPRLTTTLPTSRLLPGNRLSTQVKAVTVAAPKGHGQTPATAALAVPLGTPLQFISQPTSVVPVPVAMTSLNLKP